MKYLIFISVITLLFCLAIGFDVSPILRGPSPYPPEWRWPYFFVNTLQRIYLPLVIAIGLLILLFLLEKKPALLKKYTTVWLLCIICLSYFFQLAVLYFSRSGIGVLVHRIINPELNGYFTASLSIHNLSFFLHDYNNEMMHFIYHAKAHPPGAILLFYLINQCMLLFPFLERMASHFSPSHTDVRHVWNTLYPSQKAGAIVAGFFIPFLSTLSIFPLYYSARMLFDEKIALRSATLFFFIPSILFFIPINDAFLHIFSITSFFFLIRGLHKKSFISFFVAGVILFIGVLFNLSLLPIIVFFAIYFFLSIFMQNRYSGLSATKILKSLKLSKLKNDLKIGSFFIIGFLVLPIFLFLFFQFNFIQVTQTIMAHVPDVHTRSYYLWIFYNLYDFFVFAGLPTTIIFFMSLKYSGSLGIKKRLEQFDVLVISFILMILILNFSGSVRGETGRLWSVYMPFMTIIAASFVTRALKFSSKYFLVFLILQLLQVLVMQEFWVMLW